MDNTLHTYYINPEKCYNTVLSEKKLDIKFYISHCQNNMQKCNRKKKQRIYPNAKRQNYNFNFFFLFLLFSAFQIVKIEQK